jgi:hypothetical protein
MNKIGDTIYNTGMGGIKLRFKACTNRYKPCQGEKTIVLEINFYPISKKKIYKKSQIVFLKPK